MNNLKIALERKKKSEEAPSSPKNSIMIADENTTAKEQVDAGTSLVKKGDFTGAISISGRL